MPAICGADGAAERADDPRAARRSGDAWYFV